MCVGMLAKIADTRLVQRSTSSPVRIETGIIETNGTSGNASRSASQPRRAPAQIAMTTSFTVAPMAFFSVLMSDNGTDRAAKVR